MDPRDLDDFMRLTVNHFNSLIERVDDLEKIENDLPLLSAWSAAVATHLMLPGLRGFWPMSAIGDSAGLTSDITDISGQGRHLSNPGSAQLYGSGFISALFFDGTNDYLWRADEAGLDILGTEGFILPASRGLTLGGWFTVAAVNLANAVGFIGKWLGTGGQQSYLIYLLNGADTPRFSVSSTGAAITSSVTGSSLSINTWYHIVGRFDPGNQLSIFVDGIPTNAVSADAAIFNSTADFNIMAFANGAVNSRNQGNASLCFLSACYLSDEVINSLFQKTRALFLK